MLRFICCSFDPDDRETADQVAVLRPRSNPAEGEWAATLSKPGLKIWHPHVNADRCVESLPNLDCVVIGRVFTRDGTQLAVCPPGKRAAAVDKLLNDTRAFMADYWGNYVAFVRTDGGKRIVVVRDPSGALPCYVTRVGRLSIYFSDIHDVLACLPLKLTINTGFVDASLLLPNLPKRLSGFYEIAEVLPGERWSVKNNNIETYVCWDPYRFVDNQEAISAEAAASEIFTVASSTVNALARCFERINVQLGGLDSSAVLAMLSAAPSNPSINVMNLFTKSPRGDERYYARQVAAASGIALIERELDSSKIDFDFVVATSRQIAPKPFLDLLDIAGDVYSEPEISSSNASFTGVGGDSIFLQGAGYLPALDFAERHGWTFALGPIVANSARYSRLSVGRVLWNVMQAQRKPRTAFEHLRDGEMRAGRYQCISDRLASMALPINTLHPGVIPPGEVSKGKCLQVLSSCFSPIEYYDRFVPANQSERVDVFLTQPMVEVCLRIPSWILAHRGIDRGLERKSFAKILPDAVVRRRTKSTPQEIYDQFVDFNKGKIVDYLLEGKLVYQDFMNKDKLKSALTDPNDDMALKPLAILNLLQWESWLRGWS